MKTSILKSRNTKIAIHPSVANPQQPPPEALYPGKDIIMRPEKRFVLIIVDFEGKYYKCEFVKAETKRFAKTLYRGFFKVADAVEIPEED